MTASVLTLLYTHMLAWQPDTHSWSWTEAAYVHVGRLGDTVEKHTHSVAITFIQDGFSPAGDLCCSMCAFSPCFLSFFTFKRHKVFQHFLSLPQSFGLMCIQLACYHGVKVLTTSHSPQKHTFLEQLRPSVGMYRPMARCL